MDALDDDTLRHATPEPERSAGTDEAFEALLRAAAHVSLPEVPVELERGSSLAGGRFALSRCLGRGGMGVVYEAYDEERRGKVALKLLAGLSPDGVYRLKNELRALRGVTHENLVVLHELFGEGARWYYTMELVDGVPLDRYVRPRGALDVARLRACLDQLFAALAAIHAAGKLHRDLKPGNVLVTATGKLVVLDFGLAVDAQPGGVGQTVSEHAICGTPSYMAPEQAAGRAATEASDLYAVGVMLYECLTGRLPFTGATGEVLAAKQRDDAPSPSSQEAHVPADLERLCASLLARDPAARRLGGLSSRRPRAPDLLSLVGREAELAELREAYAAVQAGASVVVRVDGESGIGKSALCEAFLDTLAAEPGLIRLSARCHERESVPFKAFDPLVDALSRKLRRLSDAAIARLVPPDAGALTRLFPVLARVPAFARQAERRLPEGKELQQRAFAALRALLVRLRAEGPLVMHLDDLQWADEDSLRLLQRLLVEPAGFPALLIASHRRESDGTSRLSSVFDAARDHGGVAVWTLRLGPLAAEATERLVRRHAGAFDSAVREALVSESHGNPLLAIALARFADGQLGSTPPSLEAAVQARVDALTAPARALIELLALTAEPLLARAALAATGASHADVERLEAAHLVRTERSHGPHGSGRTLTCYHDRIRECIAAHLDEPRRRALARSLSETLSELDDASRELLCRCLADAGEYGRAARLAAESGDRAARALAFERAAELYAEARAWTDSSEVELLRALDEKRGNALANAGRGLEAAEAYRAAAALAEGSAREALLRRAVPHLMYAGAFEEGLALLGRLCRAAGVALPPAGVAGAAQLALARARLRARGLALAKPPKQVDHRTLETLATTVNGLANCFPLPAAIACIRYLRAALDAGDPRHAAMALMLSANTDVRIGRDGPQVERHLARLRELLPLEQPQRDGVLGFASGSVLFFRGEHAAARAAFRSALACFEALPGTIEPCDLIEVYLQLCAHLLGDFREIVQRTPPAMQRMLLHGRVWSGAMMCGPAGMLAWLVPDDPDAALRRIEEVRRRWRTPPTPQQPDWLLHAGELIVLHYRGEHERALELAERRGVALDHPSPHWPRLHDLTPYFVGYAALACMRRARGTRRAELRRRAEQSVRALDRGPSHRRDLAGPLRAALAYQDGDHASALAWLARVGPQSLAAGREAERAIVRGEIMGGEAGAALVREGRASLRAEGAENVDALLRTTLAGLRPA